MPRRHPIRQAFASLTFGLCIISVAHATGIATCESGPKSGWHNTDVLTKQLTDKGWPVRRIKEDGGCYEVYAIDDKGQRVEAYFHPVTLASVPTKAR